MKNPNQRKAKRVVVFKYSCLAGIFFLIALGLGLFWCLWNLPSHVYVKWINIRAVEVALIRFEALNGRYPTEEEGLSVLVSKPHDWDASKSWKAMLDEDTLVDGWGNSIQYRLKPPGKAYGVYSFGEDGKTESNGEDSDDINNWARTETNRYFVYPNDTFR